MYIDRTGKSRQRSRASQRRTWLTNVLSLGAGVTVSVVGSVAHTYDGVTLPTRVDSGSPVVRSNPFITSPNGPVVSGGGEIRQTSDFQLSELQLKSIGTAVGLVPIGNPRPTQPVLEVSQPKQPNVRVNPLATKQSNKFDLPVIGLVDEPTVVPNVKQEAAPLATRAAEVVHQSRTRILGLKYVESATPDVLPEAPEETEVTIEESETPAPESTIAVAKQAETVVASTEEDEPAGISFSFSDLGDDKSNMIEDVIASVEAPDSQPEVEVTDVADELMIPPPGEAPIQREPTELATTVEIDSHEHGDEGVIDLLPLLPTPNPAWTEIASDQSPVKSNPLMTRNESNVIRYPERRRAHVEVASPPMISYHAESSQSGSDAAKVESTRIVPAKLAGFRVQAVEEAESLATDGRELLKAPKPVDPIVVLDAKIRKSYSTARLQISEAKGKMLVRGVCATQEEATEIIRMIRNEFLVPVDDQIVIR